ncbi:MAG: FAD-binding protein, partial [Actinomycetota bacterium]
GRTALVGCYAVGEVSATGVHGANRLASNSLTESVVAGTRVGRDLAWELPDRIAPDPDLPVEQAPLRDPARTREVRAVMSRHVGVLRSAHSLATASGALGALTQALSRDDAAVDPSRRAWEATNLLTVATAVVTAALARTESRGCHRRIDYSSPTNEWRCHLDVFLDAVGGIDVHTSGPVG